MRTGLWMFGTASALWLVIVGGAMVWLKDRPDPIAEVLTLTFTIALWPVAALGVLTLLCWLVIRLVEIARLPGR